MYVLLMQVSVGDFSSLSRILGVRMEKAHILIHYSAHLTLFPDILVVQGYVAAGPISCHATRSR